MSNLSVVYEKIHYRHDPRWMWCPGAAAGCAELCAACAIEMMESAEVSSVRKAGALVSIGGVLKRCPGVIRDLLLQDHRVCLQFITSLLGMLHTVKDEVTLEQTIQVLVQLLLELQNGEFVQCVLRDIHTQLREQSSIRGFLPTFTFLGRLIDVVPPLGQILATQHVPLLEQLCSALSFPDEKLRSSLCYIFGVLWACEGAGLALPPALIGRLCALLLQTMSSASSSLLTVNCLGFLKQLLTRGEVVSVLMNCRCEPDCAPDQELELNSQPPQRPCSLPLILKKLLLSSDEPLQVASVQCMRAVLVQSPRQYCAPFIQADIPEFLYERLNSQSELLLCSLYSCLLLLMEDPLFFSQCLSVYGIESLVRSLKEALRMNSREVQRQGLLLLTETLEKQPAELRLFPSGPGFAGVVEVVVGGVSLPCLQVATQAARAAAALFRLNHQSSPVLYKELKGLVEAVIGRCTELPLPTATHHRAAGSHTGAQPSPQYSRAQAFLLQATVSLHAACRLAEQCMGEPELEQNAFTAPDSASEDSLQSFCAFLLRVCDTVCIPAVTRHCEMAVSPSLLQHFLSILSLQFSLYPTMMPLFSKKLASSGFFRLILERKAALCAGNRNAALNRACSELLRRLSVCLLGQLDMDGDFSSSHWKDCEELGALLERALPAVCWRLAEWPSLLCEGPGPLEGPEGLWDRQFCLLILLYLAFLHGDRMLVEPVLFSSVVGLLSSVQARGGRPLPPSVLRAALYLLSITQESSPELDWAPLSSIITALSSCPELADRFGSAVVELWLTRRPGSDAPDAASPPGPDQSPDVQVLLSLVERNPSTLLSLLGIMCSSGSQLASHALGALQGCLLARPSCDPALSNLLRPILLQILQRLSVEEPEVPRGQTPAPLVLQLLCLSQCRGPTAEEMGDTDLKLLVHAISVLLCNDGLLAHLQTLLQPSPAASSSSLLSCSRLLMSALIRLQHRHSAQVHKRVTLSLDSVVELLCFGKRKTDSLLLVSVLKLLQAALDVDLQSPLLCLSSSPSSQRPLLAKEGALQPLGSRRALSLITALYGLLMEKQELLLMASVGCLWSLLGFLQRRSPDAAQHTVSQPWTRFLLCSMLSCGGSGLLHPAVLQLLHLLVRFGCKALLWEPDLQLVLEAAESRALQDLGGAAVQTLRLLLTQLLCSQSHPPPTEEHRGRVRTLLESLSPAPGPAPSPSHRLLRLGEVSVCLSDFAMATADTGECDVYTEVRQ
ncbi:hypothetical protein GJAV_G00226290 [Gymnothorax javanicus]|nr:hypothetical protein GJAV_G00226290 [Gymnothorax javanicus]